MTRQERYHYILDYFRKHEPHVTTELQFGSAFQLLVATLLSAQCTDKRINAVTPALFAKYPTAEAMARAEVEDVLEFVSSVSYPNAKARHLVAMARQLVADYGGEVPSDPQELVKLQGVGRKTANVLQAVWFGKPVGAGNSQHTAESRAISGEVYSAGRHTVGPSLAAASWTVYLSECETEVREMSLRHDMPEAVEG